MLMKLCQKISHRRLLKAINNIIQSQKIEMTDGEAIRLWNEERPKFMKEHGRLQILIQLMIVKKD